MKEPCTDGAGPQHTIDNIGGKMDSIESVANSHVEGGHRCLLLIASHMDIGVMGALIDDAIPVPRQ